LVERGSSYYTDLAVVKSLTRVAGLALVVTSLHAASGNSWNRIRYSGGTVAARGNPYDWNTTLTVSLESIVLVFGHSNTLKLLPSRVTALSYGEKAYRHVADMVTLSVVFVNPLVLFGILHESRNHFISIEFHDDAGKPGVVLLEADKSNYRAILEALKKVTGKPVQNAP
jgi:hypothetical protein